MNLIVKLFWGSLAGFLLSFLVGVFNYDNNLGAVSLAVMIACMGTFLISMTGVADGHAEEESPGQHYARCLSCSSWLNSRIEEHIAEAEALALKAREFSAMLTASCLTAANQGETSQAIQEDAPSTAPGQTEAQGNKQRMLGESRAFPERMRLFARHKEDCRNLLSDLSKVNRRGAEYLTSAQEASAISRLGFASRGRWRTGHSVAGQYILADQIEPQQVTAILTGPLARAHNESCARALVLAEDIKTAENHLHLLAKQLAGK